MCRTCKGPLHPERTKVSPILSNHPPCVGSIHHPRLILNYEKLKKPVCRVGRPCDCRLRLAATAVHRTVGGSLPFCRCHHVFVRNCPPRQSRNESHGNSSQEKHEVVIHPIVRGRGDGPRKRGREAGWAKKSAEAFCHVVEAGHLPAHIRANHVGRRNRQRKVDLG